MVALADSRRNNSKKTGRIKERKKTGKGPQQQQQQQQKREEGKKERKKQASGIFSVSELTEQNIIIISVKIGCCGGMLRYPTP